MPTAQIQPASETLDGLRLAATEGRHARLRQLPLGALRLDGCGRILERVSRAGHSLEGLTPELRGRCFFQEYLAGTPLAPLAEVFAEGVRRGELYHFVDLALELEDGEEPRELTLFLYFHAATQQGWVFIEPHTAPAAAAGWGQPQAA